MKITRPTIMEVDLKAFKFNVEQIKKFVGAGIKIMPVIKANAYGTYINKLISVLDKFDIVAVALVDEAVKLRVAGYEKEIFVLNQPDKEEIPKIVKYSITIGASDISFIKELSEKGKNSKIHIEVDTGMGRTGVNPEKLDSFINELKRCKNIQVEGLYTHFSSADTDLEYTEKQLKIFDECIDTVKNIFGEIKYIHSSASNGILNFSKSSYNLVRPGIILYGYQAGDNTFEKLNLKPVCKLKSKITFLKEVDENTSISYSRRFITPRKSKIATIPVGYADGLRRELSNKGYVVINGKKAPIVGTVCMDSIMVDVTDIGEVFLGQDVCIWDNDLIKLEDIANLTGTINYEILCTISSRVPRKFIER